MSSRRHLVEVSYQQALAIWHHRLLEDQAQHHANLAAIARVAAASSLRARSGTSGAHRDEVRA